MSSHLHIPTELNYIIADYVQDKPLLQKLSILSKRWNDITLGSNWKTRQVVYFEEDDTNNKGDTNNKSNTNDNGDTNDKGDTNDNLCIARTINPAWRTRINDANIYKSKINLNCNSDYATEDRKTDPNKLDLKNVQHLKIQIPTDLSHIIFKESNITKLTIDNVSSYSGLDSLKYKLKYLSITTIATTMLSDIKIIDFPNLEVLKLHATSNHHNLKMEKLPRLTHLYLWNEYQIKEVCGFPKLQYIHIARCKSLSSITDCPKLITMAVRGPNKLDQESYLQCSKIYFISTNNNDDFTITDNNLILNDNNVSLPLDGKTEIILKKTKPFY